MKKDWEFCFSFLWQEHYHSKIVLAVFQCWYPHTFIMQPTVPFPRTAFFSYCKVFFSRKQQGAIRTDWKIYCCIFYHLWIMVTIFQVANSPLIFQQQYLLWHNTENRWEVIMYNHVKSKKSCHQKTISKLFLISPSRFLRPFYKMGK